MSLLNLPNELLFAIAKELPREKSVSALARTNRFLFSALNDYLYAHNVRHHNASALYWAAKNGNTVTAANSITNGADVNAQKSQAVALALRGKQLKMTCFLLAKGADPNCTDNSGESLLWSASHIRLMGFVQALLNNGTDPNIRNNQGETVLFRAVRFSYLPIVRLLIDSPKGVDVNAIDRSGQTPLYDLISTWTITRRRVFRLLLERGANAEHADNDGTTPLIHAIRYYNEDAVRLLLQHQVNLQHTDKNGKSALHVAVENGRAFLVMLIVSYGANIEAKNAQGRSPLHLAVSRDDQDITLFLLGKGANPETKDSERRTPLHTAAGSIALGMILLGRGVKACVPDIQGNTPLHLAAKAGNETVVKRLLELRADAGYVDHSGRTPLHMAAAAGSEPIIELLLRHGAHSNPKDISGLTPSDYAPVGTHQSVKDFIAKRRQRT
ncbi:ankyrin 2-3/unc44 [Penicillium lagena]|uniref:ankyrin 2-3/unc44 n=1 Tax=Penicillium lagena TaxID=94218 RepID=UPI0025424BBA|nr:ankyrin 2-3/unc44 [Penicillium lagena]KAJ5604880.1 ankyrin 2-3/unc44 [Penicillium lagena]